MRADSRDRIAAVGAGKPMPLTPPPSNTRSTGRSSTEKLPGRSPPDLSCGPGAIGADTVWAPLAGVPFAAVAQVNRSWEETEQLLMDLALYGLTVQEARHFEAVLAKVQYDSAAHAEGALPSEELEQLAKDAVKAVQRASGSSLSRKLPRPGRCAAAARGRGAGGVAQLPRAPLPAQPLAAVGRELIGRPQTTRAALQTRMRAPVRDGRSRPRPGRGRRGARREPARDGAIVDAALRGSAPPEPWLEAGGHP